MKNQTNNVPSLLKNQYEHLWQNMLNQGQSMGDFEVTIEFLNRVKIIQKNDRILEIGCGTGELTNYLYNSGYTDIIGTDLSEEATSYGKKKYKNVSLKAMDAVCLNFLDYSFDVCMAFDLIEHLPDVNEHIKEVVRVLKPNGVYLLQTPNIISNSIKPFLNRDFSWRWQHPSLQFSWGIMKKLYRAGFNSVNFIKISPFTDYKLKQLPPFIQRVVKLIPFTHLPIWLQTNFWIVAYKSNDRTHSAQIKK